MDLLGAHVSIAGGVQHSVQRAIDLGADTFQIFTGSQRMFLPGPIPPERAASFLDNIRENDMETFLVHAGYMINLASPEEGIFSRSVESLAREFHRCSAIRAPFLVMHPGSHKGSGTRAGIERICLGIGSAADSFHAEHGKGPLPMILFENTAGQGTSIGGSIEDLAELVEKVKGAGICLDTCHLHAAGHDIVSSGGMGRLLDMVGDEIGPDLLKGIHLNDTVSELGSGVDRHAALGEGVLGDEPFRELMNHEMPDGVPKVLETPKGDDNYRRELSYLRSLKV